jgi:hypothetical protein
MCKAGDIILVKSYKDGEHSLGKHSFVVISDENGMIEGMRYDLICNVLSSFKSQEQREWKLNKYSANYEIKNCDTHTKPDNGKDGYLKTDQLYYFQKENLDYETIGYLNEDVFELVIRFINESDFDLKIITDNLN